MDLYLTACLYRFSNILVVNKYSGILEVSSNIEQHLQLHITCQSYVNTFPKTWLLFLRNQTLYCGFKIICSKQSTQVNVYNWLWPSSFTIVIGKFVNLYIVKDSQVFTNKKSEISIWTSYQYLLQFCPLRADLAPVSTRTLLFRLVTQVKFQSLPLVPRKVISMCLVATAFI